MSESNTLDPFALGGRQEGDAELIRVEREIRRLLDEGRDIEEADAPLALRWKRIGECMEVMNSTKPTTLAGCAAKLRFLTDEEIGMEVGDREDDVPSLRQVLAFLERGSGGMTAPDAFALGGQQEGDEPVLPLFREWIVVCGEVDALSDEEQNDERNPKAMDVFERWNEIEDEIMSSPPGGAVALAIKAFLVIRQSHDGGGWGKQTAMLRLNEDARDNVEYEMSVLRNAATFVPEIAELAAAIIHEDAELIDLDIEVAWAREVLAMGPFLPEKEAKAKLAKALDRIAQAEAKTERGEAIKARHAQP
ncbi:MAG TPA: hypothetical protein VFC56_07485 [Stellaceae bacterium]|nr:hypothetical protein [Stellaceae bacterium]